MEDTRGVLNMLGSGHICRTKRNANFDAHGLAKIVVKNSVRAFSMDYVYLTLARIAKKNHKKAFHPIIY